jgi:hypothetical protein
VKFSSEKSGKNVLYPTALEAQFFAKWAEFGLRGGLQIKSPCGAEVVISESAGKLNFVFLQKK